MAGFDYAAYLMAPGNEDIKKAVESGQISAQDHWAQYGQYEGRNTGQTSARSPEEIAQTQQAANNLATNQNFLTGTADPTLLAESMNKGQLAMQGIEVGDAPVLDTGPTFNSQWYLASNPDVARAVQSGQMTAEEHYNQFGKAEIEAGQRELGSQQGFDDFVANINKLYADSNKFREEQGYAPYGEDAAAMEILKWTNPAAYYATNAYQNYGGGGTVKNPAQYVNPTTGDTSHLRQAVYSGEIPFNEAYYLAQNPDVAKAIQDGVYANAREHFIDQGWKEGREYDKGSNAGYEQTYGMAPNDWMDQTQADLASFKATGYVPSTDSLLMADGTFATGVSSGGSGGGGGFGGGGGGGVYYPPQVPNFWQQVYGNGMTPYNIYGGGGGISPGFNYGSGASAGFGGGQGAYTFSPEFIAANANRTGGMMGTSAGMGQGATSLYGAQPNMRQPVINYGSSGGGAGGVPDWRSGNWPGAQVPPSGGTSAGGAATPDMAQVTPGAAGGPNQINVGDFAGNIASRPANFLNTDDPRTPNINEGMFMANRNHMINPFTPGTHMNPYNAAYNNLQDTVQSQNVQAANIDTHAALGYNAFSTQDLMNQHFTQAAQGIVSSQAQVNTSIGEALFTPGQAAQLNLDDIDARATVRGQLELLQADWTDPVTGEPKIPLYAQAQARQVSKIAAFKGMTGTAATAAMSTALQEASIAMAVQDSKFYQTVTMENLSNRQQMAITNANILANMELQNADNRLAAAIENSRSFLQMDLANLNNRQQANIIDSQARIQSILDYGKEENVARRFGADATNDMQKFYDQLNSSINTFNAGLAQDNNQFNASMQNNREQFYANLQYQIDKANTEWVKNVVLSEDQQLFEANRIDVQNMVGIGQEMINRLWDRSDAMLDYAWKATQAGMDRDLALALQNLTNEGRAQIADDDRNAELWKSVGGAFFNAGGGGVVSDIASGVGGAIKTVFSGLF